MVELKNIRKSLGGKEILKGVDLTVGTGEVVVILGPSGSGKTTLLRAINFLGPADAGTVAIDGETVDCARHTKGEVLTLRRKTGMVFQNYNLFKNRTALRNITEGLIAVKKLPKDKADETARALLEKVGLADKADSYPGQLSGGQQQRVGICRALALNPSVILFDEPTSALDPELVGEVLNTMTEVAKTGITMVVVTHQISFARNVANKIVYMEGGVVVEEGPPEEVILHPQNDKTVRFLRTILADDYNYII